MKEAFPVGIPSFLDPGSAGADCWRYTPERATGAEDSIDLADCEVGLLMSAECSTDGEGTAVLATPIADCTCVEPWRLTGNVFVDDPA